MLTHKTTHMILEGELQGTPSLYSSLSLFFPISKSSYGSWQKILFSPALEQILFSPALEHILSSSTPLLFNCSRAHIHVERVCQSCIRFIPNNASNEHKFRPLQTSQFTLSWPQSISIDEITCKTRIRLSRMNHSPGQHGPGSPPHRHGHLRTSHWSQKKKERTKNE